MKNKINVGIGTKFHYTHADSNPLWEVKRARGRGTWDCVVIESPDWEGNTKTFSTEEIEGSLRMAALWNKLGNESDRFFVQLTPGAIVHNNNSFGSYVRCRVTDDHQLLPIALVGNWSTSDLPRRNQNGEIYYGYHADKVRNGKVCRPNASSIYEYQHRPTDKDPRQMTPISLELPEMTDEQKAEAAKYRKLERIQAVCQKREMTPDEIFSMINSILNGTYPGA